MIVVKLGGSLYDHPRLRDGLNAWLGTLPRPLYLVPGGGPMADAVRAFDEMHGVGFVGAHWAALRAMTAAGGLLQAILTDPTVWVYDPCDISSDEDRTLPTSWDVTSDSIAARAAVTRRATKLILLKSKERPDGSWEDAARQGFVDAYFPTAVRGAEFPIEVINFRRRLDER